MDEGIRFLLEELNVPHGRISQILGASAASYQERGFERRREARISQRDGFWTMELGKSRDGG